jgi:CRP-like cAMP-binding protein
MSIIFDHFHNILPMTEKEISEISPLLKTRTLLKDDFLLSEGQTCNFIAFIKIGSFRSFHINSSGSSINLMLNSTHDFISNLDSFISGTPSNIFIQSIEKSEVIVIHKNDINKLLENSLYWNKFSRIMTENVFIAAKSRLESIIYKTPEERYLELVTHFPEFLETYSLTDISSFIGVTPQSLSRIRARIC